MDIKIKIESSTENSPSCIHIKNQGCDPSEVLLQIESCEGIQNIYVLKEKIKHALSIF